MLLLLGALAILLRRLLAPLRRVEREIEAIEAGELTELGGGYPRELLGITTNLNALLRSERERLARYRNTLGNLAHSFKTPLAVMRNLLERSAVASCRSRVSSTSRSGAWTTSSSISSSAPPLRAARASARAPVDVREALEALRGALLKVYVGARHHLRLASSATVACSSATAKT